MPNNIRHFRLEVNRMCNKTAITLNGRKYNSLRDCWEAVGKVPYGTTKSRLHRTNDLRYALGLTSNYERSYTYNPTNSKPVILPNGLAYNSIKEMCEQLNLNKNTVYNYMR